MIDRIQLKKWKTAFFELLLPPKCCVCNNETALQDFDGLCGVCLANVSYVRSPLCSVCGSAFSSRSGDDHICEKCLRKKPLYSMARAITYYEDPVRTLLHRLKYRFDTTVEVPLLKIALSFDYSAFKSCDIIIPVPLHPKRLKRRGLNHALVLAQIFFTSRPLDIHTSVLVRVLDTISQTALDASGRKANMKLAFSLKHPEIIQNKVVCLVDDVYTTGATIDECARTLIAGGASEVKVLTMARVQPMV